MNLLLYGYPRSMHLFDRTGRQTRPENPGRWGSRLHRGLITLLLFGGLQLQCSSSTPSQSGFAYPGVYLPNPENLRAAARCESPRHYRVYYLFYGSSPIDHKAPAELFPEPERYFYLIEQDRTVSDWAVSILFGTFFTVTRGSLYVTACEIPAGRQAVAPFQEAAPGTDAPAVENGSPAAVESNRAIDRGPVDAQVQERVDAARERARAARERAERLRRENQD
ncbi:MAG: hypothetical protein NXI24_24240 [bacterium]|nr:hypothetical protein [bacterium]